MAPRRLNKPQRCPKTAPRQPRDASRWPQDTLSGGPFRGTPRKICSKRARLSGGSRAGTARKAFKSYCLNLDVSLKLVRGVARRGPLERFARYEQIFRGVRHRGPPESMRKEQRVTVRDRGGECAIFERAFCPGTPRKICSKRARLSGGSRAGTARKTFKSYCLNLEVSLKLFRGVARRGPLERLARSEQIFRGVRHRGPPESM